jgi:CRP/FNR family transcriptional regulator, cyclic AMP receptor protein
MMPHTARSVRKLSAGHWRKHSLLRILVIVALPRLMGGEMAMPANATIDLFSALPQRFSALLFAHAKSVHLVAGQALFIADDPGDGCYGIEKGLLKVSIVSGSGDERILAILGPGAIVGELAVLDGLPRSASVVALRDSNLLFLSKAKFDEFANKHSELYQHLLILLASRLRETNDVVAAESFLPLRGRVAVTLLELAEHFGENVGEDRIVIRQKFKQPDLAAMAGIARENVNRIFADWKRRKLVSRISGYYCIENKSALQRELGGARDGLDVISSVGPVMASAGN